MIRDSSIVALGAVTDIHIFVSDLSKSIVSPGPRPITDDLVPAARELVGKAAAMKKPDFMLSVGPIFFRGRRDSYAVDGEWLRFRKMPEEAPTLETLPSPMPRPMIAHLMSPLLRKGGLIYVVGSPGAGKTHTAAGTVVSRLCAYGGMAYTIEEPPEIPLNGWHGSGDIRGYCTQTWVAGEGETDWEEAFRTVLRSQPATLPAILYVGEVRDAKSAAALLRAAASGFLVIATGFGNDIASGLDELIARASVNGDLKNTQYAIANVLRVALHQKLESGKLKPRMLVSANGRTPVATKIREGRTNGLEGDIQYQEIQLQKNINLFDLGN